MCAAPLSQAPGNHSEPYHLTNGVNEAQLSGREIAKLDPSPIGPTLLTVIESPRDPSPDLKGKVKASRRDKTKSHRPLPPHSPEEVYTRLANLSSPTLTPDPILFLPRISAFLANMKTQPSPKPLRPFPEEPPNNIPPLQPNEKPSQVPLPEIPIECPRNVQTIDAAELIEFFLHSPRKDAVLLCHPFFVETEDFLKIAYQRALEDKNERGILLKAIYAILNKPHFYPLSGKSLLLLKHSFEQIPEDEEVSKIKQKLTDAINPTVTKPSKSRPLSRRLSQVFTNSIIGSQKDEIPLSFDTISQAILENQISSKMIRDLAWDLKKMEAQLLSRISALEISLFIKDNSSVHISHIRSYIQHTNVLIHFAASDILNSTDVKIRARCYEYYIELIQQCLEIENYNSAFSLWGALNINAISRLKSTWELVHRGAKEDVENLRLFFHGASNNKKIVQQIENWHHRHKKTEARNCIIPIFGFYFKNFTFIHDGNPTLSENRLNPDKIHLLGEQFASLIKFHDALFSFTDELLTNHFIFKIFESLTKNSLEIQAKPDGIDGALDELYERSKQIEPVSSSTITVET